MSRVPTRRAIAFGAVSAAAVGLTVAGLVSGAGPAVGDATPATAQGTGPYAPQIIHTGTAPTGYTATFRYRAPNAQRVQIKGEWSFEDPKALPALASTPGHLLQTPNLQPQQWQPGYVPIQSPNSTDPNFPVVDMKKGADGVWSYTVPLPSGVFDYGFYVNCTTADQSGCTEKADPSNPNWTVQQGIKATSTIPLSTVYLPSDSRFHTVDYSWQGPAVGAKGTLTHLQYTSPGHVTPAGKNYAAVYTPPGYNPYRSDPYPTLYLTHGGGENELGWTVQGDLQNIMDNLIDTGEIQPMVVVMPNNNGYAASSANAAVRNDIITKLVPLIQKQYDVSTAAADRAFSGLSGGGMLTNQFMLNNAAEFGYYGMMSAGFPPGTTLSAAQIAALKQVDIFVGEGWQDSIFADGYTLNGVVFHTGPAQEVRMLANAQIPVATDFVNGGHEWYVWRILLKDFLTRVAFQPSPAATWPLAP